MTPTPHISALKGEIADIVIMPGDPLRAYKMAERFLSDCVLVSSTRNNFCYTGTYKNHRISIMGSGMGCASMGIYSYELFNFYDVKTIIRVGTMGSLDKSLKIGDIFVCDKSVTFTNYNGLFYVNSGKAELFPKKSLLNLTQKCANRLKLPITFGTLFCTDTFYSTPSRDKWCIKNLMAKGVEMESSALLDNAKKSNKNAIVICTVSDEILTHKEADSKTRENNFYKMFSLALEIGIKLDKKNK